MTSRAALVLTTALLCVAPRAARADAIGPCPAGQHVVTNPISPGAMHHGGFHCESDCSVLGPGAARGSAGVAGSLALLAALALAVRRRR